MNWAALKTIVVIGLHFLAEFLERLPTSEQGSASTERDRDTGDSRGKEDQSPD